MKLAVATLLSAACLGVSACAEAVAPVDDAPATEADEAVSDPVALKDLDAFGGVSGDAGIASPEGIPDAVTSKPDHYSVEFENDVVRVLRARYPTGEASRMHYHPPNYVVYLTGGTFQFTSESGDTITRDRQRGQVRCSDAAAHIPGNVGTGRGHRPDRNEGSHGARRVGRTV